MLHVTVIILVCFTVPAPSEGIAVTRPKTYLYEDFCLFEEKIPKVEEVSSFSIYNVDEEHFSDCVKSKIIYRHSFYNNFFINQYRNRKNNYCSIMDNVLETKKKNSDSSEELSFRKRNLLWTRKGLNSLKTLKPINNELTTTTTTTTTTSKPLEHHTLNFIEKKRFFAIKKTKTFKRKRFRRHARRRRSGGKLKNLRKQNHFSGAPLQFSNVIWNDYVEEKPLRYGQAVPRFHSSEKFINRKRNRGNYGSGLRLLRGKDSAPAEATHIIHNVHKFTHSRGYFSNKLRENARSVKAKNLNKENRLLSSTSNGVGDLPLHYNERFIQGRKRKKIPSRLGRFQLKTLPLMKNYIASLNQLICDSRFNGNDESDTKNHNESTEVVALNDYVDAREVQYSNKQEKKNDHDNELGTSGFKPDIKLGVPDYLADHAQLKTKEMYDILTSAVYFPDLKDSPEESSEFRAPESTIRKPFLSQRKLEKEIPITDFDFPDYDEIYDKTANRFKKNYIPFHTYDRRKFKFWKNASSKKKYSKIHQKLTSDCRNPLNFKRSPFLKKLEREKKFCGTKYSDSCSVPHKCWKSAPLLCIPYIRKGQDDLLKYLIGEMQKMLGKPYPQKIDIFENTKYKPCIKKPPSNTCEDIMPHEPEDNEDDDNDENCDPNKFKTSSQPFDSCTHNYPTTSAPCPPSACSPAPTPCTSCPKGCVKSPSEPSCPPFPCPLPNLNQIYTEPTSCVPDKYYSTLPPFLLPVSSVANPGTQKDSSNKPGFPSPSPKPTELTVKSLSSNSNIPAIVTPKVPKELESLTFFPPKKVALEYLKNAKQINSDSLAGDNQLQPDQRLSDKILPELVDYQEEMRLQNVTKNASGSTLIASTSNEPFLFELPKFISDEKLPIDFSNPNITNTFKGRDLNFDFEYSDQISRQNNPINVSPKTVEQIIHQDPFKEQNLEGNNFYNPFTANENDVSPKFPWMPTKVYDGPQIDKPLHMKHSRGRFIQLKKRKFLKRQKREDDYDVYDFVNNDGYFYGANGNNEDYEKESLQQLDNKASDSDDYGWTPMQYELFSELAKMITATESNDVYSSEPISYSKTDLTTEIYSTAKSQLETNSVALTTEKSFPSVLPDELSTSKSTTLAESQQEGTTLVYKQKKINNETRFNSRSSSTVEFQEAYSERQKKPLGVNTYFDTTEDGQVLTTVGSAYIVKGPKKQMTKPSPKMFTKVYPDSVPIENGQNDTTVTATDSTTKRKTLLQTTLATTSVTPDVKLQLLAVCEGYLEVMKIMKSQNQSFAGDLDSDLLRYCESIISQSLTQQTESSKSKKQEFNLSTTKRSKILKNTSKKNENLTLESKSYGRLILGDSVLKRELDRDKKLEVETFSNATAERNENTESPYWKKKQNLKKSNRRKKEFQHRNEKITEGDDEFLKKGMTKEQVELLRLLKKRKRALLNWLFNSKEDRVQPEVEETEYFDHDDDDSIGNSLNYGNSSGTVRPRGAKSSGKTNKSVPVNAEDTVIPVYAKEYGYDKGGQLKLVEVLWRRVNDQTNEKRTLKNLSVVALVLTSTVAPNIFEKYNNFIDINGFASEDTSETRTKNQTRVRFAAEEVQGSNNISVPEKSEENVKTTPPANTTVAHAVTHTPSVIAVTPRTPSVIAVTAHTPSVTAVTPHAPSVIKSLLNHTVNTTKHPNITGKIAGNLNKAKGIVEEYTIEFWNYAVYILPITFSILFCFCCACCTLHFWRNKKSRKKKKKKKKFESTDEEVSTDATDSEPKKKRERFKKSKNIWKVWKKNTDDDGNPPEKNKSFLRFMKSKKNDKAGEGSSVPYSAVPESDGRKEDTQSEAAERRELIALLEELKKIEMEQVGEKKEQKSVHVQYMIQDQDESVFRRSEMPNNYPFYSRLREPIAEEYRIYKDAELSELLPCGCGFRGKKRDFLRNYNFQKDEENRCERFFDVIRNSGMCHHELGKNKKFTDRDRNFIFDKYRNDERNEAGFTIKVCDVPPFSLPAGNPNDWVRGTERFNNQMVKKKPVRLKDDGVLCRL